MSYCSSCGKAIEPDWMTCPYCQHPCVLTIRSDQILTVRTDIDKEINNLVELAVMKLNQGEVSEFDRIFLSAKEKDVKLGFIKFQEDYRIFNGLLNCVETEIIFLEEAHRKMVRLIKRDNIHKFEIQVRGENALAIMEKAGKFSHHDLPLFNAFYSRIFNILSHFDLLWNKHSMKRRAKQHRDIARKMIADDPMTDYKEAKIALNQSLRSKQKLNSTTNQMYVVAIVIWGFIFIMAIFEWF